MITFIVLALNSTVFRVDGSNCSKAKNAIGANSRETVQGFSDETYEQIYWLAVPLRTAVDSSKETLNIPHSRPM